MRVSLAGTATLLQSFSVTRGIAGAVVSGTLMCSNTLLDPVDCRCTETERSSGDSASIRGQTVCTGREDFDCIAEALGAGARPLGLRVVKSFFGLSLGLRMVVLLQSVVDH